MSKLVNIVGEWGVKVSQNIFKLKAINLKEAYVYLPVLSTYIYHVTVYKPHKDNKPKIHNIYSHKGEIGMQS